MQTVKTLNIDVLAKKMTIILHTLLTESSLAFIQIVRLSERNYSAVS